MVRWSVSRDMNNFLKINRQNLLVIGEFIVFLIGIVSRLTVMKQGFRTNLVAVQIFKMVVRLDANHSLALTITV